MSDQDYEDDTVEALFDCAVQDFHAALSFVDADPRYIKDHIFCGHLQGCVEKLVKAVLRDSKLPCPRTHDLGNLFGLLGNHGRRVPPDFALLIGLTIYSVGARYGHAVHQPFVDRIWFLNLVREFAAWLVPDVSLS